MKLNLPLNFIFSFLCLINITIASGQAPNIQSSNIVASNITSTSATITWTNGNGENRLVFVENPSSSAAAPSDNNTYTASSDWNSKGSKIGTSNYYCVYNGSGNSVTLTNLPPNSRFAVRISEYNGAIGSEKYNTTIVGVSNNPINFYTLEEPVAPTVQASDIVVTNISSTSATLTWTKGNGENCVVFVENPSSFAAAPSNNMTYIASNDWSIKGTKIGNSQYYCVYNGSGNSVTITNLPPDSRFAVRISEYNGAPGNEQYNTTIAGVSGNPVNFYTLKDTSTDIEKNNHDEINVSLAPNPTNGIFRIKSSIDLTGDVHVSIFSLTGKMVYNNIFKQNNQEVNLSNEAAGIYLVKITSNNNTYTMRLVKK